MSATLAAALIRAIRAERSALGLTQEQLGERLGWSRSQITKIENGDRIVPFHELPEICTALEITLADIVRRAPVSDRRALGFD